MQNTQKLAGNGRIAQSLIAGGADVNLTDKTGKSPLERARERGIDSEKLENVLLIIEILFNSHRKSGSCESTY